MILLIVPMVLFTKEFFWLLFIFSHPYPGPDLERAFSVTCVSLCAGFFPVLLVFLLAVGGQAIAPINTMNERFRTAWHLWLFILSRHGVATAVRDGKVESIREPEVGPVGMLVIDFNSAVVVEENLPVPNITRPFRMAWRRILISIGLMDTPETPRIFGPGLAFLRPGAYIHSVIDLRRQFRMRGKVPAYTRDGIEVQADISALFQVGGDPTILPLTFFMEKPGDLSSLRLVSLSETPERLIWIDGIASNFKDEFDQDDWAQIQSFLMDPEYTENCYPYELAPLNPGPPVFDRDNIFAAAFTDALDQDGNVIPWHDLPVKVSVDVFRQLILQYNYDQLYGTVEEQLALEQNIPENSGLLIMRVPQMLGARIRNSGVRYFRLIHSTQRPLVKDRTYSPHELLVSEAVELAAPKVLRNARIAVIFNSFSDLSPVSDTIYQQRLDTWRARWYAELKEVQTGREIQAIQQTTQARMQTQEDLVRRLRMIIENASLEPNVAAIRVYMEMEILVSDPATRKLLPQETIMLMRMLQDWASRFQDGNRGMLQTGGGTQ